MLGILVFFWDGLFSGVMLASRSVTVEATNISSFLKLSIFCFLTGALGIYICVRFPVVWLIIHFPSSTVGLEGSIGHFEPQPASKWPETLLIWMQLKVAAKDVEGMQEKAFESLYMVWLLHFSCGKFNPQVARWRNHLSCSRPWRFRKIYCWVQIYIYIIWHWFHGIALSGEVFLHDFETVSNLRDFSTLRSSCFPAAAQSEQSVTIFQHIASNLAMAHRLATIQRQAGSMETKTGAKKTTTTTCQAQTWKLEFFFPQRPFNEEFFFPLEKSQVSAHLGTPLETPKHLAPWPQILAGDATVSGGVLSSVGVSGGTEDAEFEKRVQDA